MLHLIFKNFRLVVVWALLCAVLAFGASFFFPRAYNAESQVLIISRDRSGIDPYTQAKSAERIGENLAQIINTTDFYDKVVNDPALQFDRERWQKLSERDRRKQWQRDVRSEMIYNTSLLKVTVHSPTKDETLALSNAVTQELVSQGWEYVGGDVVLKTVNNPLVSRMPARPNFALNTVVGFVLGALLACVWIVRYKQHHSVFGKV